LPERALKAGQPDLTGTFISLFTNDSFSDENWAAWLPLWQGAFEAIKTNKDAPLDVTPNRRNYYEKSAAALCEDHPAAALWLMLRTWTHLASVLPKSEQPYKDWQSFTRTLELDGRGLHTRVEGLDSLLDSVETSIEAWREDNG
jgi:hypothetical protein